MTVGFGGLWRTHDIRHAMVGRHVTDGAQKLELHSLDHSILNT